MTDLRVRERVAALRESTVVLGDEAYPTMLAHIYDPPTVLHFRGDVSLLKRPMISIVGSRRCSAYGRNAARTLADSLAKRGVAVVSGLARGIDAAAHQAALEAGGATIAVLGCGIDIVYPRGHEALFARMAADGLILTELGPGAPPLKAHFPIRNRIISGLAYGTVIVEATERSGSLITARSAAEQGRDVFAVPHPIFAAGGVGPHRLVQYGAKLVHDAEDIVEELPREIRAQLSPVTPEEAPPSGLLDAFSREEPTPLEEVAARLQKKPESLAQEVLQLELDGWLESLPGARYVRVR
ncbi:MAG TPA: DNA-processing protein DprA [Thermoanaerobaculia bacterium]